MPRVNDRADILIAGGGMVGLSLALALVNHLPSTCRIVVSESINLAGDSARPVQPCFDARSTALAYGSRMIFESLGVWPALAPSACPIRRIHVSEQSRFGVSRIAADHYGLDALGYVIENRRLGTALLAALEKTNVTWICPSEVTAIHSVASGMQAELRTASGQRQVTANLVVVADGGRSGLGTQLGLGQRETDYQQQAIVTNVAVSEPHRGQAWERFLSTGPIALLPLNEVASGEHRMALIWTLPTSQAEVWKGESSTQLLARLQQIFGSRAGRFLRVGAPFIYPLKLVQSLEQVRPGLAVVGNAAHTLHPVAGQGFNLALRNVALLAAEICKGVAEGKPAGDLSVLQAYHEISRQDQAEAVLATDKLVRLFTAPGQRLGVFRDIGLAGFDVLPATKEWLTRHAMGLSRPLPRFVEARNENVDTV